MGGAALAGLGSLSSLGRRSNIAGRPDSWSLLGLIQDGMRINFAAGDDPVAQGFAFTRGSTGTYVGSNGLLQTAAANVLRYAHDPVTPLGALIEKQSTQLVPNTTTEVATISAVGSTGGQTDPFGGSAAYLVTANSGVAAHYFAASNVPYVAGTTYTLSRWIKPGTCTRVQIAMNGSVFINGDEYANFLLTGNGSVSAQGAGVVKAGIDAPVNGFYRIWLEAVADVSGTVPGPICSFLSTGSETRLPSIDGTGLTMTVYGSQVEAGPLSSYIVPAGASTTRMQDQLMLVGTVGNVASWFNNAEGTFVWRGRVGPAFSLTAVMMAAAGDATMANAQWLYLSATARRVTGEGRSGGAATLSGMVMGSTIAAGQDVVASWAYGADYGLAVASGVAATADTSGALPVGMSRFSIGSGAASGLLTVASQLIASIEYYPRKLSQSEQLALTY